MHVGESGRSPDSSDTKNMTLGGPEQQAEHRNAPNHRSEDKANHH
jgi:hypothetical protein